MYPNLMDCAERIEKSGIALKSSNNPHVPIHSHKWFEMAYILKGKTEYVFDGKSYTVEEGNYYIIDYDVQHQYRRINDEPFQIINIMFSPQFIDQSFSTVRRFEKILETYPIKLGRHEFMLFSPKTIFRDTDLSVFGYINEMQSEYSAQKIGYREMMRGILSQIIIQIVRNICVSDEPHNTDNRSYIIADYIRMHFSEKIKIEDAFPDSHYSISYMSKSFKTDMGMTFTEYLKKVRIEESCRMLVGSTRTIAEIAESVGYPDTTSFHKAFRTLMSMSPNEYRKLNQTPAVTDIDEMVYEPIGNKRISRNK